MKGSGSREVQSTKIDNRSSSCPAEETPVKNAAHSLLRQSAGTPTGSSWPKSVLSLETPSAATNLRPSVLWAPSHIDLSTTEKWNAERRMLQLPPFSKKLQQTSHARSLRCTAFENRSSKGWMPASTKDRKFHRHGAQKRTCSSLHAVRFPLALWSCLQYLLQVSDVRRPKVSPKRAGYRSATEFLRKLFDGAGAGGKRAYGCSSMCWRARATIQSHTVDSCHLPAVL